MPEPASIPRHRGIAAPDSFENLRRLGLGFIQELAGSQWTDFNLHDPGVTILEQVCYALTDVMYRADFPVEDLLVDEQGGIDWEQRGLLPPETVFPSRATTPLDYRALILDAVPEVENVAMTVVPADRGTPGGLYRIGLRLRQEHPEVDAAGSGGVDTRLRESDVLDKVRRVFLGSRNLCEDLDGIDIVPANEFTLRAEVEIAAGADPAAVLARIYYACDAKLCAGIDFLPYDRALTRRKSPEQMFRGPFTACGMVDGDRGDPPTIFPAADVYALIKEVEGVEAVKVPRQDDPQGNGALLRLHWPQSDEELQDGVKLTSGGLEIKVSLHEVNMRFQEMNFDHRGLSFQPGEIASLITRPMGQVRDIMAYRSVQHHFPPIYRLGRAGIPNSADDRARARARQLRAYLLLFDQHLADYLAMLGHLRQLFSTGMDKGRTYFFQAMDDDAFPGVAETYDHASAGALKELLTADRSAGRTQRLLDYFLALYGESFRDDGLRKAEPAMRKAEGDAILDATIAYLKEIEGVTRDRGAGADTGLKPGDPEGRAGLEVKLSHLLGFEKRYRADRVGVRVMEHILLRPIAGGSSRRPGARRYAFRISVLLPAWPDACKDPSFRQFAADTVVANCPAHIFADVHWLSREIMQRFDGLHLAWWVHRTEAQLTRREPQRIARSIQGADVAARALLRFLILLGRKPAAK